jgi:quercetin dioxygenase-like cupin family protein
VKTKEEMTKETLMTQQTIDQFGASDSIGRANSNYTKVEESIAFTRGRLSLDRSVWYSGQLMTFLATAEDTQGKFALIEAVARRGNDPPPHIHHREEETFYVLEGEMTFSVGGQTIKATPGTMVCLPRDVAHSFVIDSEQVRMLILLTPAGFEGWFKEFSVPAPAMTLPPQVEVSYGDIQRMLESSPRYGIEIVSSKS